MITVLDRTGDSYVIGDPLEGRIIRSRSELRDTYEFTGFFMLVSTGATPGTKENGNFPKNSESIPENARSKIYTVCTDPARPFIGDNSPAIATGRSFRSVS